MKINLKQAILFELASEDDSAYIKAKSLKWRNPSGTKSAKADQIWEVFSADQLKQRADLLTLAALGEEVPGINSIVTRVLFKESKGRRTETDIHKWVKEVVIPRWM